MTDWVDQLGNILDGGGAGGQRKDALASQSTTNTGSSAESIVSVDIMEAVTFIMETYGIATLTDTEEMLYYSDGVYRPKAEIKIRIALDAQYGRVSVSKTREIIEGIKRRTFHDRTEFDKDPDILNVANCLVNVRTGERLEHTPEYLSIIQLAAKYDPNAFPTNFVRFLRQVVEPKYLILVYEMIGYGLLRSADYQTAFMVFGVGSNGKSVTLDVIAALFGEKNISRVALQSLDGNRFAAAELYGKMVNIVSDLPAESVRNTGIFKMVVSGDPIQAEKKNKDPFTFKNTATLIYSANKLPETYDDTNAYYRRWRLIPYPRTFDLDATLLPKLTTELELSGLLNLAILGLRKIRAEGEIRESSIEDIRQMYDTNSNSLAAFALKECEIDSSNREYWTPVFEVYDRYLLFCRENKLNAVAANTLGTFLKQKYGLESKPRKRGAKQVRGYFGMRLKPQWA